MPRLNAWTLRFPLFFGLPRCGERANLEPVRRHCRASASCVYVVSRNSASTDLSLSSKQSPRGTSLLKLGETLRGRCFSQRPSYVPGPTVRRVFSLCGELNGRVVLVWSLPV